MLTKSPKHTHLIHPLVSMYMYDNDNMHRKGPFVGGLLHLVPQREKNWWAPHVVTC